MISTKNVPDGYLGSLATPSLSPRNLSLCWQCPLALAPQSSLMCEPFAFFVAKILFFIAAQVFLV